MGHSRPLFLLFSSFLQTVNMKYWFNKSCRWLDSNPGPLISEATALPTAPQPLPQEYQFTGIVALVINAQSFCPKTFSHENFNPCPVSRWHSKPVSQLPPPTHPCFYPSFSTEDQYCKTVKGKYHSIPSWPPVLFVFIQLLCFCLMNITF